MDEEDEDEEQEEEEEEEEEEVRSKPLAKRRGTTKRIDQEIGEAW